MSLFDDLYTQIFRHPPIQTASFLSKTIVVTGANTGLGLEACKHFCRLGATRIIAGVRSHSKGEATKAAIESDAGRTGVVECWLVDYSSYASVKEFGDRVAALERVDAVVLNAGLATLEFVMFEDSESTITVNVVR